jgi:ABC-type glycerol-3-phosphate transport system permease component
MSKETPLKGGRVAGLAKRLHLSKGAVNIVLALVAVFWLVPTISLLVISLRPESLFGQSGWWKVLTAPTQLNLSQLRHDFFPGFHHGRRAGLSRHLARDHDSCDDSGRSYFESGRL